jgi:hypothetical protein
MEEDPRIRIMTRKPLCNYKLLKKDDWILKCLYFLMLKFNLFPRTILMTRFFNFQKILNVSSQVGTTFSNYTKINYFTTSIRKHMTFGCIRVLWTQQAGGQNLVISIFYVINEKNFFFISISTRICCISIFK